MKKVKKETDHGLRLIGGVVMLFLSLFVTLTLFSYDWRDISILHVPPLNPPYNLIGPVGAWLAFVLFFMFGIGAWFVPLWCLIYGIILSFDREERAWPRGVWLALLLLGITAWLQLKDAAWVRECHRLNIIGAGGLFGSLIVDRLFVRLLSVVGTAIIITAVMTTSLIMLIEPRNIALTFRKIYGAFLFFTVRIGKTFEKRRAAMIQRREQAEERERERESIEAKIRVAAEKKNKPTPAPEPKQEPIEPEVKKKAKRRTPEKPLLKPVELPPGESHGPWQLPPLSLLNKSNSKQRTMKVDVAATAHILVDTLKEFGIETEFINAEQGPVVTRYELLPAPGIRVERIGQLSNNLALSLKATSVRVQAPVPGKGVVGVEVPNEVSKVVLLRDILEGEVWQANKAALPLVLGQDVGGNTLVADLARMPHMLIAGATGAGKTVCMNSILAGLLMSRTPDQMRLMLVDPKIVEFSVYNNLPHLVVPVITDPKKVSLGLRWAINEMEKRYKLFAKAGVRNIASFNSRKIIKQGDLFGENSDTGDGLPATVPYIVIVIDELADLMLADQAGIENSIARLAQLSRAVGIHMILSTQRPSVNVITGTIKANFPARVAFQVAQRVDSRTILDSVGAEKLLGRGDMLFLPPGTSKLVRAQGALTSDEEIVRITDFLKQQGAPSFEMEIKEKLEKKSAADVGGTEISDADDELLEKAVAIIRETRRASTSSLQRRLRIGYNRAGRLMDVLEERGIIGPPNGSDPREILIDLDGEIPDNADGIDLESDAGDDTESGEGDL